MNIKTQKLNNLVKRVLYERSILLESAPCNNDWDCADNKWCGSHPPCEARACAYGSRGACACIRTDCGGPDRIADDPIITTQGGVDKTDVDVKMDNDRKMMGENTNTRLNEGKTRCNGRHVGGGDYNDPPCTGGQECHRRAPFTNLFGCFDCVEGKRCGYDDMNYRPGMDTTYMDVGFEDFGDYEVTRPTNTRLNRNVRSRR